MKGKRIWIVSELFYPDETSTAYIFTRIANFLSLGYKVCVICGPKFYFKDIAEFTDRITLSDSIEVYRTKSIGLNKNSLFQRAVKILILSLSLFSMMIKNIKRGETVIMATNPALLLLFAGCIKQLRKIRLHILVHDVFPENTIPAGIYRNNKVLNYRILKYLFDGAYAKADHLIVLGRDMREVMLRKLKHTNKKPVISVVTNWTDPGKFTFSNKMASMGKIIFQYAGNIGRVQGLKELLEAFRMSNNSNIILMIRGSGANYPYIENYIRSNNLSNIILEGSFSRDDESQVLEKCDIGIVSLSEGMFGLGVPSKSYHILSAGKPVLYIGEPETEISQMVLENEIGWSLDITKQNDIVEFFRRADLLDHVLLKTMGHKARLLAEKEYTENLILGKFRTAVESVEDYIDKKCL